MEGNKSALKAALLALAIFWPLNAAGQTNYSAIGGAEWDTEGQSLSYLGAGAETPIDAHYYLTGKVFAGFLKYKFESGGTELTAEVPIVTPSIGIKYQKEGVAVAGSAGADFRRTKKELIGGGTETNSDAGLALQAEAYLWWEGKESVELIANYSSIDNFFWTRARAKKGVSVIGGNTDLKVGAEAAGMGNSDFTATQAGVITELYNTASNLSILLKAGYKTSSVSGGAVYGGLEAYYGF